MVFVCGPRQVGKTTLAKSLRGAATGYLSWDVAQDRERILRRELPPGKLWIFDEVHKYRSWRGFLKGISDVRSPGQRILVTGSARLDYYRYGGDSLQGRYHTLRLHPFSAAELDMRGRRTGSISCSRWAAFRSRFCRDRGGSAALVARVSSAPGAGGSR
jgi:predicted AAA+ superfamily ATPase